MAATLKLTEELITKVQDLAAVGLYLSSIAPLCGISRKTMSVWFARGKAELTRLLDNPDAPSDPEESIYARLVLAKQSGEAQFVQGNLEAIRDARAKYWQAAAWLLERRCPGEWSTQAELLRELTRQIAELSKRLDGLGR